ncbi:MAG: HNH endonuclease [Planctomycetaceae bacterium]|nr:HNH endonuclease [Planctomycetaceae bacterium]
MRKLDMPAEDAGQVFRMCIGGVRNAALRRRLASVEANIVADANAFRYAASTAMLHTMLPEEDIAGIVSKSEMSDVYTQRMAKKGSSGRPIYDKLLAAPAHGRCPLCGQRTVSTLDHHLPKAHYPTLAVVPINLIPTCADCNRAKTDAIAQTREEQTLHPYFDNIENDSWLEADVIEDVPASLRFCVSPPVDWDESKAARVRHHFKVFKLAALYASHAAEELAGMRYRLKKLFDEADAEAVVEHLWEEAESRAAINVNSWQTAMYRALASSNWYCNGGFRLA